MEDPVRLYLISLLFLKTLFTGNSENEVYQRSGNLIVHLKPVVAKHEEEEPGKLKEDDDAFKDKIVNITNQPFISLFTFNPSFENETTPPSLMDEEIDDLSFQASMLSCKLSPSGVDFKGTVFYTQSYNMCLNWNHPFLQTTHQNLTSYPKFENRDFPDRDMVHASHYCRNPDNSSTPWCYRKIDLHRENCKIKLCQRTKCQFSGPGMEYRGFLSKSMYGDCLPWSYEPGLEFQDKIKITKTNFSFVLAYCRNPTYDQIGPYCYVDQGQSNDTHMWIEKSYCDVPFCDTYVANTRLQDRIYLFKTGSYIFCVHGRHNEFFTHYTLLSGEHDYINISIRSWSPHRLYEDEIRIALTVIAVPATGPQIRQWKTGFEIIISNNATGVTVRLPEVSKYIRTPSILTGTHWTNLTIGWENGKIYMIRTIEDNQIKIFNMKEMTPADSILGIYNFSLQYFSVIGSPVLMRIFYPEPECEEQITTENEFVRFYQLFRDHDVRKMDFALRTLSPAYMLFRVAPMESTVAEIKITFHDNATTYITLKTFENSTSQRKFVEEKLGTFYTHQMISFYDWTMFSLRIRDDKLLLSLHTKDVVYYVFDIKNIHINVLRYFSIASRSTAYWTIGCIPDNIIPPKSPFKEQPSECSMTYNDEDYGGQVSVSAAGRTCLPWVSDFPEPEDKDFSENEIYENVNFCRNTGNEEAAFCYVYNTLQNHTIIKDYCEIPKCNAKPCRTSGTSVGNVLDITTTFTGRHCKKWKNADEKFKNFFKNPNNLNLYARRLLDINVAKNFCRNPNLDLIGPWCATTDPEVEYDACEVPDCERKFQSTMLLITNAVHRTYIKPFWRINGVKFWLKPWDGSKTLGFKITMLAENETQYFQIKMGVEEPKKVVLLYGIGNQKPVVIDVLTPVDLYLLEHELWTGFHLTMRTDRLTFGYEGEIHSFINWTFVNMADGFKSHKEILTFYPKYLTFEKVHQGVLGMSVDCTDPFLEILSPGEDISTYYPMNFWLDETNLPTENITFNFRGTGDVIITFYNVISFGPEMKISFGSGALGDRFLVEMTVNGKFVALAVNRTDGNSIVNDTWTNLTMMMNQTTVIVFYEGEEFLSWSNPRPLIPFYFALKSSEQIKWIVNAEPPDIDTPPIKGGWSDWTDWNCSVSCGGGRGFRTRFCTSPTPSLFGLPCDGESFEFGLCNGFKCGDISSAIVDVINYRLKHYLFAFKGYSEESHFSIPCFGDILDMIKNEAPTYKIYWDKNGEEITEPKPLYEIDTSEYEHYNLKANINDTGTFACVLVTPLVRYRPITVASVIIRTKHEYTKVAFSGDKFKFRCNNIVLANIYKDLEQIWYHGEKTVSKYSEIHISLLEIKEVILEVTDSGIWECVVRNKIYKMQWSTNWIHLKVKYRSDFIKYLMVDNNYTKIIFADMRPKTIKIVFALFVVVVAFVAISVAILLVICQRLFWRCMKEWFVELTTTYKRNYYAPLSHTYPGMKLDKDGNVILEEKEEEQEELKEKETEEDLEEEEVNSKNSLPPATESFKEDTMDGHITLSVLFEARKRIKMQNLTRLKRIDEIPEANTSSEFKSQRKTIVQHSKFIPLSTTCQPIKSILKNTSSPNKKCSSSKGRVTFSDESIMKDMYGKAFCESSLPMNLLGRYHSIPEHEPLPDIEDNRSNDSEGTRNVDDEEMNLSLLDCAPSYKRNTQIKNDKEVLMCFCTVCSPSTSSSRVTETVSEEQSDSSSEYWSELSKQLEVDELRSKFFGVIKDPTQRDYW